MTTAGIQQLFQHITAWSRVPSVLTTLVDPWELSTLSGTQRGAVESLNRYVRDMRLQEIQLLKSLQIDPDRLSEHLKQKKRFPDFFQDMNPHPKWMGIHPDITLTVDDMYQMHQAIVGAKRRLNIWDKRLHNRPDNFPAQKPAALQEYMRWLQGLVRVRSELAQEAVKVGSGEAGAEGGISQFYEGWIRKARRLTAIEESLKFYFPENSFLR